LKKAFTLVELLVAVSIIVVVLLSLFGVFHGTVVGYLSVKENSELNRMLIAFDLDLNASITGLIPSLPADYTYLYIPPDRGDGLQLSYRGLLSPLCQCISSLSMSFQHMQAHCICSFLCLPGHIC